MGKRTIAPCLLHHTQTPPCIQMSPTDVPLPLNTSASSVHKYPSVNSCNFLAYRLELILKNEDLIFFIFFSNQFNFFVFSFRLSFTFYQIIFHNLCTTKIQIKFKRYSYIKDIIQILQLHTFLHRQHNNFSLSCNTVIDNPPKFMQVYVNYIYSISAENVCTTQYVVQNLNYILIFNRYGSLTSSLVIYQVIGISHN